MAWITVYYVMITLEPSCIKINYCTFKSPFKPLETAANNSAYISPFFFFFYKTALIELNQSHCTMTRLEVNFLLHLPPPPPSSPAALWNWTEVQRATHGQGWMAANTFAKWKKKNTHTQKESGWVLDTRLPEAHCLWAPSVFIPGFVSHHDTYFSLKHKRLFVTIVSPVLALYGAAQWVQMEGGRRGDKSLRLDLGKWNKTTDYLLLSSAVITLSARGRPFCFDIVLFLKIEKSALSLSPAPLCALHAAVKPELKRFTSEDVPFFSARHFDWCFGRRDGHCRRGGAGIELAQEDVIPFEWKRFWRGGRFARDDRWATTLPLVQNNVLAWAPCVVRRVPHPPSSTHRQPQPIPCKLLQWRCALPSAEW